MCDAGWDGEDGCHDARLQPPTQRLWSLSATGEVWAQNVCNPRSMQLWTKREDGQHSSGRARPAIGRRCMPAAFGRARQAVPLQPLHPLQPQCIVSSNPPASGRAGLCFLASVCTVPACCGICDIAIAKLLLLCRTHPQHATPKRRTKPGWPEHLPEAKLCRAGVQAGAKSSSSSGRGSAQIPLNTNTVLDAPNADRHSPIRTMQMLAGQLPHRRFPGGQLAGLVCQPKSSAAR